MKTSKSLLIIFWLMGLSLAQGVVLGLDLCRTYKGDLGVAFSAGADAQGLLTATVVAQQKLLLLGFVDVQANEAVRFQTQAEGNVKIMIPRLNREQLLLSPGNGGWWPMLGSGLGLQPDNTQRIGCRVAGVGGVITNPLMLEHLGVTGVAKSQRVEMYCIAGIMGKEFDFAGVHGPMPLQAFRIDSRVGVIELLPMDAFVLMFLEPLGRIDLPVGLPVPTAQAEFNSAMAQRGVAMLHGKRSTVAQNHLSRTGLVYDVEKFKKIGLGGAQKDDHVHLVPKGKLWQMVLCRPKTTDPVAFHVNDKGAIERVDVKWK